MTLERDYAGKLAIVTGAGDGIGEMLARRLAGIGMQVGVQDIRAEAAEAVAADIGGGAFPMVFDVSDRDACLSAADAVRARGPLSLLWLNAGVGVGSPILSGKPNLIEWALDVNVRSIIWSAQAFVPLMEEAEGPRHVGVTASSASIRSPEGTSRSMPRPSTGHLLSAKRSAVNWPGRALARPFFAQAC
ncbi:MAG: hypothetical protein Hens2KO_19420 [Henriciella sp.]